MIQTFQAKLTKKIRLTSDVFEFEFSLIEPGTINFLPGQFISIKINETTQRSYSLFSTPQNNNIVKTTVKFMPNGLGSEYLNNLQEDDEVEFTGPLGILTQRENNHEKLFFATGTGIAPLRSIIENFLSEDKNTKMKLVFGVRYIKDIFWNEYFQELARQHENFSFQIMISRPESELSPELRKGRISAVFPEVEINNNLDIYICGNGSVVDDTVNYFTEKGIPKENIIFERFNNL